MYEYYEIVKNQVLGGEKETDIIHFYNISESDKNLLINVHKIDKHSINSFFDPDEVPRLEI